MAESAKDQVRAILAETRRRKEVWALMQKAAHEALQAVTVLARKRGVQGQKWLGGTFPGDSIFITFPTRGFRLTKIVNPQAAAKLIGEEREHTLQLHGGGTLERPSKTTTYEGYPYLHYGDVEIFKAVAVEELMKALNEYIVEKRRQQKRR